MPRILVLREFPYTLDGGVTTLTAEPGQMFEAPADGPSLELLIGGGYAQLAHEQYAAAMPVVMHVKADPIHVTAADIERYGKEEAFARALRAAGHG